VLGQHKDILVAARQACEGDRGTATIALSTSRPHACHFDSFDRRSSIIHDCKRVVNHVFESFSGALCLVALKLRVGFMVTASARLGQRIGSSSVHLNANELESLRLAGVV
jgi:hypothetical protein